MASEATDNVTGDEEGDGQPAGRERREDRIPLDDRLSADDQALARLALQARGGAYVPHTGRAEGAALRCQVDGEPRAFAAGTVECGVMSWTMSGLRTAVVSAVGAGGRDLEVVVVVGDDEGDNETDRRTLLDHARDARLLVLDQNGELVVRMRAGDLPPQAND